MTAVILIALVWVAVILKGLSEGPRVPRRPAAWDAERDRDWSRVEAELQFRR